MHTCVVIVILSFHVLLIRHLHGWDKIEPINVDTKWTNISNQTFANSTGFLIAEDTTFYLDDQFSLSKGNYGFIGQNLDTSILYYFITNDSTNEPFIGSNMMNIAFRNLTITNNYGYFKHDGLILTENKYYRWRILNIAIQLADRSGHLRMINVIIKDMAIYIENQAFLYYGDAFNYTRGFNFATLTNVTFDNITNYCEENAANQFLYFINGNDINVNNVLMQNMVNIHLYVKITWNFFVFVSVSAIF